MTKLQEIFGETVHLGRRDGCEIVFLEKLPSLRPTGTMASNVGGRTPIYSTGLGKAILAYLPETEVQKLFPFPDLHSRTKNTITTLENLKQELIRIKQQEYAIDDQENEEDVFCIAAPIFDHKGITAALSISGPANRMGLHLKEEPIIDEIQQAAVEISNKLGYRRGVDQVQIPGQ